MAPWRRNALGLVAVALVLQVGLNLALNQRDPVATAEPTLDMAAEDSAAVEGAARELGARLSEIAGVVDGLAAEVAGGRDRAEVLHDAGRSEMGAHDMLMGLAITEVAEPWGLTGLLRVQDRLLPVTESKTALGTFDRDSVWFHLAQIDGAAWHRPQPLPTTGELVIVYAAPICSGGPCDLSRDAPVAVLSAMVGLRDLEEVVRSLELGPGAETMLVSREGDLLVHARMDLVRKGLSAHSLAWKSGDAELSEALAQVGVGRAGAVGPRTDPQTGRNEHLSWKPFEGRTGAPASHALIAHVPIADPFTQTERRHSLVLRVGFWTPTGMLLLLLVALLLVSDPNRVAWIAVAGGSVAGILIITGLWTAAAQHPTPPAPDDQPILSSADLATFERHWTEISSNPRFEPIGMFLQSVEFQSANNVTISGIAWQRFGVADCDAALAAEPEPRFFFPEADPGEELQLTLAYHQCNEARAEELVGWRFRALLRQDFDYLLYPFDPQELWVRLLPLEFDKNVVLVPDLLSYDRTARESMPGLDRELILPGWDLVGSGFAYRRRAYNTDFGIDNYVGQTDFPELVYTVTLRRSFLGPFVGKVIPLGVAAAMLFCMLLLGTRKKKYEGAFGFSAMEVVLGAAALFFVVIFDHSALRDDLATTKPFYLEYFYFVMYLALVGVCGNAIAFAMERGAVVRFRDNVIPKMLFWPVYLGAIAGITMAIFW